MKKKSCLSSNFKSLDFLGLGINFKVGGKETSKSYFGAAMTLLCSAVVGAYAIYQLQLMILFEATDVSYFYNKNFYSEYDKMTSNFSSEDYLGFNVAFGIIDENTYKSVEGIERTGSFQVYSYAYEEINKTKQNITIRKCTEEDKR